VARKSSQLQIRVTPAQKAALKRLARRAGLDVSSYVLARVQPPAQARMAELVSGLGREPDRFALAELNDLLSAATPAELRAAVGDLDVSALSPFLQNYIAAMVEQAAARNGDDPPPWAGHVAPLDRPHFAVPFPRLRPYLLRASPVAFKRRNIFIDATLGDRV
jgi:hypothetical protein